MSIYSEHVHQVLPAPTNHVIIFHNEDNKQEYFTVPAIALALTVDSGVTRLQPLISDVQKGVVLATDDNNYVGYVALEDAEAFFRDWYATVGSPAETVAE